MTLNRGTFRYLPPSGVPIRLSDILAGLCATFTGERAVDDFNQEICTRFGVRHALTISSGRAALSLLFQALQTLHPERDEVVLPAYTSFSVPSAVVSAGLKVSLYDLEVPTLSPAMSSLEQALSDRTLCIVVCNLYGYPCNMDVIRTLAASRVLIHSRLVRLRMISAISGISASRWMIRCEFVLKRASCASSALPAAWQKLTNWLSLPTARMMWPTEVGNTS